MVARLTVRVFLPPSTRPAAGGEPLATEGLAVLFSRSAPDPGSLVGLQREFQAVLGDRAGATDLLGERDRFRGGLSDREKDGMR